MIKCTYKLFGKNYKLLFKLLFLVFNLTSLLFLHIILYVYIFTSRNGIRRHYKSTGSFIVIVKVSKSHLNYIFLHNLLNLHFQFVIFFLRK